MRRGALVTSAGASVQAASRPSSSSTHHIRRN
jgi:hypothetical protein